MWFVWATFPTSLLSCLSSPSSRGVKSSRLMHISVVAKQQYYNFCVKYFFSLTYIGKETSADTFFLTTQCEHFYSFNWNHWGLQVIACAKNQIQGYIPCPFIRQSQERETWGLRITSLWAFYSHDSGLFAFMRHWATFIGKKGVTPPSVYPALFIHRCPKPMIISCQMLQKMLSVLAKRIRLWMLNIFLGR